MRVLTRVLIEVTNNRMAILVQIILSNLLELIIECLVFYALIKLGVF